MREKILLYTSVVIALSLLLDISGTAAHENASHKFQGGKLSGTNDQNRFSDR